MTSSDARSTRQRACAALCVAIALVAVPRLAVAQVDRPSFDNLGDAALAIAREFHPRIDVPAYEQRLTALARKLSAALEGKATPEAKLRAMGTFLYDEQGYGNRAVRPPDVFVGLDEVLDKQQWNCLGLSLLYAVLGERVGLPLRLVSGPGHMLVQYRDAQQTLYVETTDRGRLHPTLEYLREYLPYPCATPDRFHVLDRTEAVATLLTQSAAAVLQGGRAPQAIGYFRQATQISPRSAEAWGSLGMALSANGALDEAAAALRQALELDPKRVEVRGELGNVLHSQGRLPEAIAAYRKALEVCPDDPKSIYNLAQLLYEAGKLDESMAMYRTYLRLAPDDPAGYTGIAFPLEDKGDLDGARKAYERALERDPRNADALVNLGLVRVKQGAPSDAIAAYRKALELRPDYTLAHEALGEAYLAAKEPAKALEAFDKALAIEPDNAEVVMDKADALLRLGRLEDAQKAAERAVALAPKDPDAHALLAAVLVKRGNLDAARQAAAQCRALGGAVDPAFAKALGTP